jgi:hypothetical protein
MVLVRVVRPRLIVRDSLADHLGFTFWTAGECEEGGIWILNEKKLRSVSFSFFTHTTNGRAWAKRWRERKMSMRWR